MDARFASCCLLSYNRPQFVRTAIESCITKAEYPLEMIVHDDGSDPETVAVLMELRDAGLISLLMLNAQGNNEGQGIALNRMFWAAKGDPIIKMDHDLEFSGGWLRRCVELLEGNRKVIGAHGPKAGFQPEIGALGLFKYHVDPVNCAKMVIGPWQVRDPHGAWVEWEEHQDFVGSAMVIPRRAWEEFGPFEERSTAFAEDAVFKHAIRDRGGWANALFPFDLAVNRGFGVGPSTVVVAGPDGPEPSKIHDMPKVLGP